MTDTLDYAAMINVQYNMNEAIRISNIFCIDHQTVITKSNITDSTHSFSSMFTVFIRSASLYQYV